MYHYKLLYIHPTSQALEVYKIPAGYPRVALPSSGIQSAEPSQKAHGSTVWI